MYRSIDYYSTKYTNMQALKSFSRDYKGGINIGIQASANSKEFAFDKVFTKKMIEKILWNKVYNIYAAYVHVCVYI